MSTHATILATQDDGRVLAVYVNFHRGDTLEILQTHYNNDSRVRELLDLGDLSFLAESPDAPEGHCHETPVDGHCVAYRRDRGERGQHARMYQDLQTARDREAERLAYHWEAGNWVAL